jgi:hypothetical protein
MNYTYRQRVDQILLVRHLIIPDLLCKGHGNVSSDAGSTVEEEPGCFCFAFAGNHADSAGKPAGSNVGSGGIRNNITLANTNAAGAKSFRPKLI